MIVERVLLQLRPHLSGPFPALVGELLDQPEKRIAEMAFYNHGAPPEREPAAA